MVLVNTRAIMSGNSFQVKWQLTWPEHHFAFGSGPVPSPPRSSRCERGGRPGEKLPVQKINSDAITLPIPIAEHTLVRTFRFYQRRPWRCDASEELGLDARWSLVLENPHQSYKRVVPCDDGVVILVMRIPLLFVSLHNFIYAMNIASISIFVISLFKCRLLGL